MARTHVALIRGINVGRSRQVAMADLRTAVANLGYAEVRTLLNSGNVVFSAPGATPAEAAERIEEALASQLGVPARVTVLTAEEFAVVVAENPLTSVADNPSRLLVAFSPEAADLRRLESLLDQDWHPEALALGTRAAYLWCPNGVIASRVAQAVGRALGDDVTTRSWATTLKIAAMLDAEA